MSPSSVSSVPPTSVSCAASQLARFAGIKVGPSADKPSPNKIVIGKPPVKTTVKVGGPSAGLKRSAPCDPSSAKPVEKKAKIDHEASICQILFRSGFKKNEDGFVPSKAFKYEKGNEEDMARAKKAARLHFAKHCEHVGTAVPAKYSNSA